jgi:hypothetical protein
VGGEYGVGQEVLLLNLGEGEEELRVIGFVKRICHRGQMGDGWDAAGDLGAGEDLRSAQQRGGNSPLT